MSSVPGVSFHHKKEMIGMRYRRKRGSYMFTDKRHSIEGMSSVIVGVLIWGMVGYLSYKSSLTGGNGPVSYGIFGFYGMILSFAAFVVGLCALRDKEVFRGFPMVGTILNGALFLVLFVLYMIGIGV